MQKLKLKCSIKSGQIVAHKNTQAFLHNNQRTNCWRRVFYEWTIAEFTGTWRLLWMTAPSNSAAVTAVATHLMHRKGYQSKLLVVYSKGGRCNFWGFLHYDYRKSPWWVSRDGPQHEKCSKIDRTCDRWEDLKAAFLIGGNVRATFQLITR